MLPDTFSARGVADPASLPVYPFRDDSLLYWNALKEWVADYVGLYYLTDQQVQLDTELTQWRRELSANDGGRVAGFDSLSTVGELVNTLTLILYTCSVQHAAVNFPQYDLMSYIPNMPLAAYAPPPTQKSGATLEDFLAMLPPMDMAELQMELGYLLGTVHYTQLGQYEPFADPRVEQPLRKLQQRLAAIGASIQERNLSRRPYTFLNPAGVPQSINV
jgi:arachidonate 15-lipoxygenase